MPGVGINLPTAVSYNFRTTKSLIARTPSVPSVTNEGDTLSQWQKHHDATLFRTVHRVFLVSLVMNLNYTQFQL
jgi:hypothetical protein